jgi:hypothetical protein
MFQIHAKSPISRESGAFYLSSAAKLFSTSAQLLCIKSPASQPAHLFLGAKATIIEADAIRAGLGMAFAKANQRQV